MLHRATLDNGLRILVEPRRGSRLVASWLRIGAGAAFEEPGAYGAAHFVEHMLFKGGGSGEPGGPARRMEALGGDLNAYTGHEETVIHCVFPAEHLEEALAVMGGMASQCAMLPDQVELERGVVMDELAEAQGDPSKVLGDALTRRAWGRHPYGRPVLGTPWAVAHLSREHLLAFHSRWYQPNNMFLVLAGAVELEAAERAARLAFPLDGAPLASRPPCPPPPRPRGVALARPRAEFRERLLEIAFMVPGHGHGAMPALDLFMSALGDSSGGLLSVRLEREEGLATATWSAMEISAQGGLAVLGLAPGEAGMEAALEGLGGLLWEMLRGGLSLDHLERARALILAERLYMSETAEARASTLAWYEGHHGDAAAEERYRAAIQTTSLSQVDRVARELIRPTACTLALLDSKSKLEQTRAAWLLAPGGHLGRRRQRAPGPPAAEPSVTRTTLPGGVRLLVETCPDAPLMSICAALPGGSLLESPRTAGHTRAWASLLAEGGGDLDATTWNDAIDALSGVFGGQSHLSTMGLLATFPPDRALPGLALALAPLVRPRFDLSSVERVRGLMEEDLDSKVDDPRTVAWDALVGAMFPRHPFRLPPGGTDASLARLGVGSMRRLQRRAVRAPSLVIGIAGPVEARALAPALGSLLASLPSQAAGLPLRRLSQPARRLLRVRGAWSQGHLLLGLPLGPLSLRDRLVGDVVATVLGSPGGRLFAKLREEGGLSYDTSAELLVGPDASALVLGAGSLPHRVEEVRRAMEGVLDELRASPPGSEEVARAGAVLAGQALQDLERSAFRADCMARLECVGLDGATYRRQLGEVSEVCSHEVGAWIRRHLEPGASVVVEASSSQGHGGRRR